MPKTRGCWRRAPAEILGHLAVSSFTLVPEGQDVDGVVDRFMAIQRDIAGGAEADREFAQGRFHVERATDVGGGFQCQQTGRDQLARTARCLRVMLGQERPAALESLRCPLGDDQS